MLLVAWLEVEDLSRIIHHRTNFAAVESLFCNVPLEQEAVGVYNLEYMAKPGGGGTIKNKGGPLSREAVMKYNPIEFGRAVMGNKGQGRPKAVLIHFCNGKSLMEIEFRNGR